MVSADDGVHGIELWRTDGTASGTAMVADIDPTLEPIPVVPAAHFHLGGLKTDVNAHTNVAGLWAVGEVADR